MTKTKLILLGTGYPVPLPDTYQTSSAIIVDDTAFIIDCGGGTTQRLSAVNQKEPALAWSNLTRLILTHLHPDHTAGLVDFMLSTWVMFRKTPLIIYGPKGTKAMCDLLVEAYKIGIDEHLRHETPITWPLLYEVQEYDEGILYQDEKITITAFRVEHGALDAFGLKFVTPDKTIVMSGDTCKHPNVIEQAKGCDILFHEVYSERGLANAPARFPVSYFRQVHTSTRELAEIANETRPGLLILGHQMKLIPMTDDEFVKEITDHYDGKVVYGRDLDVFE